MYQLCNQSMYILPMGYISLSLASVSNTFELSGANLPSHTSDVLAFRYCKVVLSTVDLRI